jgi:hypothetical protein
MVLPVTRKKGSADATARSTTNDGKLRGISAASAEWIGAILGQPRDHPLSEAGSRRQVRGKIELRHEGLDHGRGPVSSDLGMMWGILDGPHPRHYQVAVTAR